jgi:O-antigen/teichoic acid export membrane protein
MTGFSSLMPLPLRQFVTALLKGGGERGRSGRGAISSFAIRVFSAGLAFASQVLLARWMGTFAFGIFTYASVCVLVLGTLCSLGFAISVVKLLPEYRERGQHDYFRGFLAAGRVTAIGAGALCAAICAGLLFVFPDLVADYYRWPLIIALLCLPAFALTDFQDGVGRAQGWFDLALIPPYVLRPLLLLVIAGSAFAIAGHAEAWIAAAALVAATTIAAAVQFLLQARRMHGQVSPGPQRHETRRWIRLSLPLFTIEGMALLILNLDILLLNLLGTPPGQIGIYFAALRTISLISFVHFSVSAVAMPRFAALHARGDRTGIIHALAEMQKWCFLPSAAAASLLLALGKPLLWMFGPEFTAAYPLMFVVALGLLARAFAGPAQNLLVMAGHQDKVALILVMTIIICLGLGLALIPVLGTMGAAIATAAAFSFEAVANVVLARRYFTVRKGGEAYNAGPAE